MNKVIFQNMISLDGYYEGPNQDISWHVVNDEFNDYALELGESIDTLLFGRITYELMAGYWPTEEVKKSDGQTAAMMNRLNKVVFSNSLKNVEWENSRLATRSPVDEVRELKEQNKKDMAIFGSDNMSTDLHNARLIDEYRIFVAPVAIGAGKPLFAGISNKLDLKLMDFRVFSNGLVLNTYLPS